MHRKYLGIVYSVDTPGAPFTNIELLRLGEGK